MVRNMQFNQRLLLAISILCGFVLLVLAMLLSWILATNGLAESPAVTLLYTYHLEVMILVSVLGIVVGASMFFLMSERVQIKTREAAGNAKLLLSFLSDDEKAIVQLLLANEGHTTQAQASHLEDMTRLRAHRTVLRLADKKIVRIEKLGKTNQLWLASSIYDALKGNGDSQTKDKGEKKQGAPSSAPHPAHLPSVHPSRPTRPRPPLGSVLREAGEDDIGL